MAKTTSSTHSGGIGFAGLLAIVFIVLKLIGKIAWSWWWVLSPLWLPPAVILAVLIVVFFAVMIANWAKSLAAKSRARAKH